jgi:hypothetical protein
MEDLTGKKFNRFKVIEFHHVDKYGAPMWMCLCDCGNKKVVRGSNLMSGHSKSCGCFQKDMVSKTMKKHGDSFTRLYGIWTDMRHRCRNKNIKSWESYGGKGIKVCKEWRKSYLSFKKWALENGYNDNLTIDRIDVEDDYKPSNCRWATKKQQSNNRSNNRIIKYQGKELTLKQWSELKGIAPKTLAGRLDRGWSVKMSLEKPVAKQ